MSASPYNQAVQNTDRTGDTTAADLESRQHDPLIEALPLGVIYQDRAGTILYANPAAKRILCIPAGTKLQTSGELFRNAIRADLSPFQPEQHPARLALESGEHISNVVMGILDPVEQQYRWIQVSAIPEFEHDSSEPRRVSLIVEEVTAARKTEHDLQERTKELRAFYNLAEIAERSGITLEQIYQEVADMLPGSLQYPESAFARVLVDDHIYSSAAYVETPWNLTAPIYLRGVKIGRIEVGYGTPRPGENENPFLPDENRLVNAIAERLGRITERRAVEQELRRSNERYRLISENTTDVIWIMDAESQRFKYVSPASVRLRGFSIEEILQQTVMDALTPESVRRAQEYLDTYLPLFLEGKTLPMPLPPIELEQIRKDGTTVQTEINPQFVRNELGQAEVIGISRDITERKQAEAALRESEQRYRRLVENIPDVVYTFSSKRGGLYHSPNVKQVLGYSAEQLAAQPWLWNQSIHPEDLPAIQAIIAEFEPGKLFETQYRIRDAQGNWRWLRDRAIGHTLDNDEILIEGLASDITEQHEAQEKLRQSEEANRAILNATLDSILLLTTDGTVLKANDTSARRMGVKAAELPGKNIFALLPPDVARRRREKVDEVVRTGRATSFEDERAGMYFLNSIYPVIDPDGRITRVTVYGRDVTEMKLATRTLQESADRFNQAQKIARVGSWELNLQTNRLQWSDEIYRIFGLDPGIFKGTYQAFLDAVHPEDRETVNQAYTDSLKTRQPYKIVHRLRLKDGTIRYVQEQCETTFDANGTPLRSMGTVQDITDLVLAEEKLRQSQMRLDLAVKGANAGLWDWHIPSAELVINSRWAEMLGYSVAELEPVTIQIWERLCHPDDLVANRRQLELHFAGESDFYEIETRMLHKNGEWVWVLTSGQVTEWDSQGHPLRMNGTHINITRRKQAEQALAASEEKYRLLSIELEQRVSERTAELIAANTALEKASRLKDEFLASMSHELRTPLTGILGLAEVMQLKTYGTLNEKQLNAVKNIQNSGQHLLDLINDILDLSKIEADKLELQMEPCLVTEICQASLQLTKGMAHKKGLQVHFSAHPVSATVNADPRRLKQMLVNLLSNAVKFTPAGGAVGLEVRGSVDIDVITFTVWDTGIGIKPEDIDRLFKPFVQLDSSLSRQYSGTGLGLSLVSRLAEMHGGNVRVESTPGEGSRFIITLPWTASEPPPAVAENNLAWIRRCLLIEDNDLHQRQVSSFLKSLGIETFYYNQGSGAFELASRLKPDVILLDLNLPDLSGEAVLRRLKGDPQMANTVVVISSVTDDRSKFTGLGAAGYLVKPFTLDEMRAELARLKTAAAELTPAAENKPAKNRVLMADDNPVILETISDFLQSNSYEVITAHDGTDLLRLAAECQPDIILADIQMPGMDGIQAIRQIRTSANPDLRKVPIIAITALAMPGDEEKILQAGANLYMSKPVSMGKLISLIPALIAAASQQ